MRFGLIAGTILYGTDMFKEAEPREVQTPHGPAFLLITPELAYLPRHGIDPRRYILPHKINHPANMWALRSLGVGEVVSLNSTGSLKPELGPGAIVIPDDYICLGSAPTTAVGEALHVTPGLSASLSRRVGEAARSAGVEVVCGGVYWQSLGPRLETRAEIRMLSAFADLVGMTLGGEAPVAGELGLEYAALCSIDNYGHGLVETPLTEEQIREGAKVNRENLLKVVAELVGRKGG